MRSPLLEKASEKMSPVQTQQYLNEILKPGSVWILRIPNGSPDLMSSPTYEHEHCFIFNFLIAGVPAEASFLTTTSLSLAASVRCISLKPREAHAS